MSAEMWLWIGFSIIVLGMLALDLGILNRKAHEITLREAAIWSIVWISLALSFDLAIFLWQGSQPALEFLTGYLIEYSLSVDNIFVFVLIFGYFAVPRLYQHRLLFWGIFGALVMRGLMIVAGTTLIKEFHWVMYLFGAFLVFTGIRMAVSGETEIEPENNPVVNLFRRLVPVTHTYHGQSFFVRHAGRLMATPLFVVLLLIETTDLIFAVDSIPAIFGITTDPFIVYTSNVFAILGLRSLYFLLAGIIHRFHYLQLGLSIVLSFVGVKMLIAEFIEIPIGLSLAVIAVVLASSIIISLLRPPATPVIEERPEADDVPVASSSPKQPDSAR